MAGILELDAEAFARGFDSGVTGALAWSQQVRLGDPYHILPLLNTLASWPGMSFLPARPVRSSVHLALSLPWWIPTSQRFTIIFHGFYREW